VTDVTTSLLTDGSKASRRDVERALPAGFQLRERALGDAWRRSRSLGLRWAVVAAEMIRARRKLRSDRAAGRLTAVIEMVAEGADCIDFVLSSGRQRPASSKSWP
jgi:hypothetical protein